jgi:hypothetical protein
VLVASIKDLNPVDVSVAFPETSFPSTGVSDEFLSQMGYARVVDFLNHDAKTEKLIQCKPYYNSPFVYIVSVSRKTSEEMEADRQVEAKKVRLTRNKLLSDCDWTQLADCQLTQEQKSQWAKYRQALRDVPSRPGFPWVVDWPSPATS